MIKETITYKDFDGTEVTDTLWFNISKSELTENLHLVHDLERLQSIVDTSGGERTLTMDEVQTLLDFIKTMMRLAYGERKDVNGRIRFKKEGVWEDFKETAAYDYFLSSLFDDPLKGMNFIVQVLPQQLLEEAAKQEGVDLSIFEGDLEGLKAPKKEAHPLAMVKPVQDVPLPETDDEKAARLESKKQSELSRDDLLFLMQRKMQPKDGAE